MSQRPDNVQTIILSERRAVPEIQHKLWGIIVDLHWSSENIIVYQSEQIQICKKIDIPLIPILYTL
jgi:hypothetical protein